MDAGLFVVGGTSIIVFIIIAFIVRYVETPRLQHLSMHGLSYACSRKQGFFS